MGNANFFTELYILPYVNMQMNLTCIKHITADLPQLEWNSTHRLLALREILLNLSLPDFEGLHKGGEMETAGETDWQTAMEDVWAYVDSVAESGEVTTALLYSK